jgi:purine-cytosine permease-like protein
MLKKLINCYKWYIVKNHFADYNKLQWFNCWQFVGMSSVAFGLKAHYIILSKNNVWTTQQGKVAHSIA